MKDIKLDGFVVRCETPMEEWRARSFYTKEPGTLKWLSEECKSGDEFYDIGANIGLYSLYAAAKGARVFAFEPHLWTATSLMRNVLLNGMSDRISVFTIPLGSKECLAPFYYSSKIAGSSGSQLDIAVTEAGERFEPAITELKFVARLDRLVGCSVTVRSPKLIKIDTDGNELQVLLGAKETLGHCPVRSVQVEVRQSNAQEIASLMTEHGFARSIRHDTENGTKRIADGVDPETVTHNRVFYREKS